MSSSPFNLDQRAESKALSTSPFYARHADGRLESVGTGIFVEHVGRAFVVTAAHVLQNYIHAHELLIGGRITVTVNQRHYLSIDEHVEDDLGFIPLRDEQRAELGDVRFLTINDMAPLEHGALRYYIVGYRADDNAPTGTPTAVNAGWSVYALRSADADAYRQRRMSNAHHLLLRFDRHNLRDPAGPVDPEDEPEGMSGSGVWSLVDDASHDKLVAIVTAHVDSSRLIYATGMMPLLRGLGDYATGILR